MNSPPQLRRGGAPKGEPDRAKPKSKVAGVVLVNEFILLTNTTSASTMPRLSPPQQRRRVFGYSGLFVQSQKEGNVAYLSFLYGKPSAFGAREAPINPASTTIVST